MEKTLLLALLCSFLLVVLITPLAIKLIKKLKLIDDPTTHKHPAIIHTKPIPRGGGLPIYIGIVLSMIIFLPLNPIFISVIIAGSLVVGIGLLDDRFDVSPYLRFGVNILSACIVVFAGVTIPFITDPLGAGIFRFDQFHIVLGDQVIMLPWLSQIFAVVWIVWVMNMLNWSKGVDGQMPGIAAISAIIIGIASLRFGVIDQFSQDTSTFAFIVAGGALGFLIYNFYPAKIFPGYSATILGFALGVLSILSSVKLATALLVMGIPAADAIFTIVRRLASKKSPFWHDRGHLHHLLLKRGVSQRKIAFFYWSMSILLGSIALTLSSKGKIFAIILVMVLVIGGILALRYITNERK
jgi:UDP-GlcNAc:undecaprenyl-phosphate GlcNAc-1-phosphate transferase